MAKKIPDYILSDKIRNELAEINSELEKLKVSHQTLISKAKSERLHIDETEILREIIDRHNYLNKKFAALAPPLMEIISKMGK